MSRIKPAVSLYSLQDEYLNHRMDLADIMRYVKEQGAEGVEILPDQMLKGAPHISDETLNQWNCPPGHPFDPAGVHGALLGD